ncbi:MAG: PRTRC system protein C [Anaerolineae bacterium]
MSRIFRYDNREFPDPDANLSVDEVRQQLSAFFPELANAETREERRGENTVYTFSKRIGTKGVEVVEVLRRVPETRLRVFELAAELIDADGELDVDAAGMRQPEINLAIAEAEAYAKATRQAVGALQRLLDP